MKKLLLIIIFLITSLIDVYGQNYDLVLKNKISGKEKIIKGDSFLKVFNKNGFAFRGLLKVLDTTLITSDTVIALGTNNINIKEISAIKFSGLRQYSFSIDPFNEPFKNTNSCQDIIIEVVVIAVVLIFVKVVILISEKNIKVINGIFPSGQNELSLFLFSTKEIERIFLNVLYLLT